MWTNYYLQKNKCKCCGRDDQLHIGKSSYWREFAFKWYNYLDEDWVEFLWLQSIKSYGDTLLAIKKAKIIDECWKYISQKDFKSLVRKKKNEMKHKESERSYFDSTGNYFSFYNFF